MSEKFWFVKNIGTVKNFGFFYMGVASNHVKHNYGDAKLLVLENQIFDVSNVFLFLTKFFTFQNFFLG